MNAMSYTVIGVMPPGFYLNRDVTIPANVDQLSGSVRFAVRQERGHEQAQHEQLSRVGEAEAGRDGSAGPAEMNVINARLEQAYPDTNAGRGVAVSPLSEFRADRVKRAADVLMLLMGAVSFVLLIACANVANLQLARVAAQQRDCDSDRPRASRLRIVRQLMTEMLLLALVGGVASLLVGLVGTTAAHDVPAREPAVLRLDRLTIHRPWSCSRSAPPSSAASWRDSCLRCSSRSARRQVARTMC